MVHAGARVQKMAQPCLWVTTSPKSATFHRSQDTSEGEVGCLAILACLRIQQ